MRATSLMRVALLAAVVMVATTLPSSASATVPPPVSTSNIPCTKLASATNPTKAFATPVSLRNPALSEIRANGNLLPTTDVIRAAGGVVCEWSNGLPFTGVPGGAFVGVHVEFLHAAAAGYWMPAGGFPGPTLPEGSICFSSFCQFSSSAGDDWLQVSVFGARSDAVAVALGQSIRTALQLGSESTWAPVPSAHPLGIKCETVIPGAAFRAAVGSTVPLVYFPFPPGWSIWHEAIQRAAAPTCSYLTPDGSTGPGRFRSLPSGSWGFDEASATFAGPGPMLPFTRVALAPGDRAFVRCNATRTHCILDAIIAEHWVQVELVPYASPTTITRPRLDALADLLRAIQTEIYT